MMNICARYVTESFRNEYIPRYKNLNILDIVFLELSAIKQNIRRKNEQELQVVRYTLWRVAFY